MSRESWLWMRASVALMKAAAAAMRRDAAESRPIPPAPGRRAARAGVTAVP